MKNAANEADRTEQRANLLWRIWDIMATAAEEAFDTCTDEEAGRMADRLNQVRKLATAAEQKAEFFRSWV